MKEKASGWFLYILAFLLLVNIIRSWINLQERGEIIDEQQDRLQKAKEEHDNFQRRLIQVKSKEYIEQEARNKLNLGKEGEIILLLPTLSPIVFSTPTPAPASSNLEQWLNVFL